MLKRILRAVLLIVVFLLIWQGSAPAAAEDDRGLTGAINGTEKVRMRLSVQGSQLTGFYFSETLRTMISLTGTIDKEKNVTLKEFDFTGVWVATFKGKWTAKGFTGTWASQDGKRKYPFSLTFTSSAAFSAGRFLFAGGGTEGVFIYDGRLQLHQHIPTASRIIQLRKDAKYLYVLEENNRLKIYDIKNPAVPVLVTEYTELVRQMPYTDFFLENDRLVFFNSRTGLLFVDVKDRKKPVILGTYAVDGRTPDFAYANRKGYFYDEERFYVVDFTDVKHPSLYYETEHGHMAEIADTLEEGLEYELRARIVVNGPRVYLLGVGMTTYDLRRKEAVRVVRSEMNPYVREAVVFGRYLYVTTTYSSLCVYELVGLESAKLIREYDAEYLMDDDLHGMLIQDSRYLYIASGRRGISLKDVEDPKNILSWTCSAAEGGFASRLFVYKGQLLVQNSTGKFALVDPVNYKTIRTFDSTIDGNVYKAPGSEDDLAVLVDDRLLISDGNWFLHSLDLNQKEPEKLEFYFGPILHMKVKGSSLYTIYQTGIDERAADYMLDVRPLGSIGQMNIHEMKQYLLAKYLPEEMQSQIAAGKLGYIILSMFFKDQYLYVEYGIYAHSSDRGWQPTQTMLAVLDPADLKQAVKAPEISPLFHVIGFINEGYALSLYTQIMDFKSPLIPKAGEWLMKPETAEEADRVYDIEMIGSLGYLALGEKGLYIYDFTDPAYPLLVKKLKVDGNVRDVAVIGSKAFVAAGYNGYLVYDIGDPKEPKLIHNAAYQNTFQVVGY